MEKLDNSYVKTLDSFWPIHDPKQPSANQTIGELRVKLFLEDLGPMDLYKQSEENIEKEIMAKGLNGESSILY